MDKGKLKAIGRWLWNALKPPSGVQARRVVMAFTLLVVVGRFGLAQFTSPVSAARIDVIPAWQYGVVFLMLFVALVLTTNGRRLTWAGFVTSVCGFALYVVQAYDVWPVYPSFAYYGLMALILLAEGAVIWKGLHRVQR